MFILTVEYLSGKIVGNERQYRLTTVRLNDNQFDKHLSKMFDEYFILDIEEVNEEAKV